MRYNSIPDRREGLVSPEEAPFAGTDRQNCQKLWLLCFSRWPVLLCSYIISHDKEALTVLVEYSVGALSSGVITESHCASPEDLPAFCSALVEQLAHAPAQT